MWWAVILIAVLAVGLLIARSYLASHPLGKGQRRWDASHFVRSLLVVSENGGYLGIDCPADEEVIRVVRVSGDESDVRLRIEVPSARLDDRSSAKAQETFSAQGLSPEYGVKRAGGDSIAFRLEVRVNDIWDETCGAQTARIVHLLLDSMGIELEAVMDFRLEGARKLRRPKG